MDTVNVPAKFEVRSVTRSWDNYGIIPMEFWVGVVNSPSLFRTVPSPTPYNLLFPKIGGSQPPPKTPIDIISGMGKATNFKFGRNIHRVHPNKTPLKILDKRERGHIQGLPNFLVALYYLRKGIATNFKFCTQIYRLSRNNSVTHLHRCLGAAAQVKRWGSTEQ